MRRRHALVIIAVLLTGCGKDRGPAPEDIDYWTKLPAAPIARFVVDREQLVAEGQIGPEGGTLRGAPGTPVEAVVVQVPPGALTSPTLLSLGFAEGTFENVPADEQSGLVIVLHSSGQRWFDEPLEISFPAPGAGRIPVPFYVREDGRFEVMAPQPVDVRSGRGSFLTWHASLFTVIKVFPGGPKAVKDGERWNGFHPVRDGFAIGNFKNRYVPGYACMGMAAFAKWYREHHGSSRYLGGTYRGLVPTKTSSAISKEAHELIATRALNSVRLAGNALDMPVGNVDDIEFVTAVRTALRLGSIAVPVGVTSNIGHHVVLAIGDTPRAIAIYDPNDAGVIHAIEIRVHPSDPNRIQARYGIWRGFTIWDGEFATHESFEHIKADADVNFHDEHEAKIEVESHTNGQKVKSEDVSLKGKVFSGLMKVSQIQAVVTHADRSESESTHDLLPAQDEFEIKLRLKPGKNKIKFVTHGISADAGRLEVPNYTEFKELQLLAYVLSFTSVVEESNNCGAGSHVFRGGFQIELPLMPDDSGGFSGEGALKVYGDSAAKAWEYTSKSSTGKSLVCKIAPKPANLKARWTEDERLLVAIDMDTEDFSCGTGGTVSPVATEAGLWWTDFALLLHRDGMEVDKAQEIVWMDLTPDPPTGDDKKRVKRWEQAISSLDCGKLIERTKVELRGAGT